MCIRDYSTPKSVKIDFISGSEFTNCTVYTGLTSINITGTTICVNMEDGDTCNLDNISPEIMEIYVKIVCDGCCEKVYHVITDTCYGEPLPPDCDFEYLIEP
jgi:hypothetical protein